MEKNVGLADRAARVIIGLGLAALIYFGLVDGLAAIILGIVVAYLLVSAILSRCLFYKMAGMGTCVAERSYSTTDDRAGF